MSQLSIAMWETTLNLKAHKNNHFSTLMDSVGWQLDRAQWKCVVCASQSLGSSLEKLVWLGVTQMSGDWNHLKFSHSYLWLLGWHDSKAGLHWNLALEHLCMVSPFGVGFTQYGGWVPTGSVQRARGPKELGGAPWLLWPRLRGHVVSLLFYYVSWRSHKPSQIPGEGT